MYNPLDEQFLFQEMRDRAAGLEGLRRTRPRGSGHGVRRWWQHAPRSA